jgi:hypothetical protein
VGGAIVHVAVSAWWTAVLVVASRHRRLTPFTGAVAGVGIAALDLGIIGRHNRAIAALPQLSQWADHVAFGAVVGGLLAHAPRSTAST